MPDPNEHGELRGAGKRRTRPAPIDVATALTWSRNLVK
jgi:hypothetical protein